jgi:Flp pilus assembly protein TadD
MLPTVKGFYPSAIAELNDAAEKMPEHPTVLYHLGLALWKNGDKEKALETVRKALDLKKKFPEEEEAQKLLKEMEIRAAG